MENHDESDVRYSKLYNSKIKVKFYIKLKGILNKKQGNQQILTQIKDL